MDHAVVVQALDDLIRSRSILRHPFYVAWQRGELTPEQLATYARLYYPHVAAFPGYLEAALSHTDDPVIRAELESNLADERAEQMPHTGLWLDFAEELGCDRNAVTSAAAHAAAADTVRVFARLSGQSLGAALAALYAYESQQPEVARQKADGLRSLYGVQSPKALAYFDVHATADIQHREGERHALACCADAGTAGEILQAAGEALDAYWRLLDGICEAAGVPVS